MHQTFSQFHLHMPTKLTEKDIFSVSRLNSEVRAILEGSFPLLWVQGEISNLATPNSGHIYFSLKDPHAQVRCAMFRMKRRLLRFLPKNGMEVVVRARISLYEGRGDFQLIIEQMEPAGEGALQQAFDALKAKLAAEGLFDTECKRPLPPHPKAIGVITSPSGAAIRDVLTVLNRRHAGVNIIIYPTQVQGVSAPAEIIKALHTAVKRQETDLLIVTRGGGSLEDLQAFNDEQVARSIAACPIPTLSAVGHEIDFTIADFVADRRAPTPSAAAEIAVPDTQEINQQLVLLQTRIAARTRHGLQIRNERLHSLQYRLEHLHPGNRLLQHQQRIDELEQRLCRILSAQLRESGQILSFWQKRLSTQTPNLKLQRYREKLNLNWQHLLQGIRNNLGSHQQRMVALVGELNALSPLNTLERGYSITRDTTGVILQSTAGISVGDLIETQLADGSISSQVTAITPESLTNPPTSSG